MKPTCPECGHGVFAHRPEADAIACDKCGIGFPVRDLMMCKTQDDFNKLYKRCIRYGGFETKTPNKLIEFTEKPSENIFSFYNSKG